MIHPNRWYRLLLLAGALLLLALASGCSRKDYVVNPGTAGQIGWNNTIFGLLRDRTQGSTIYGCMSCHNSNTAPRVDLSDYATVVADSDLVQSKIGVGGNMRGYLKAGEPEIVLDWIARGAPR